MSMAISFEKYFNISNFFQVLKMSETLKDVRNLRDLPGYKNLEAEVFQKYEKSWLDFIEKYSISSEKEPEESDFTHFFENLKGYLSPSTMWSIFSHLNKAVFELFGYKIQAKFPQIAMSLKKHSKNYVAKRSKSFSKENLDEFFATMDIRNRYFLVRAVVAIMAFFGGNKIKFNDLKEIQYGGK